MILAVTLFKSVMSMFVSVVISAYCILENQSQVIQVYYQAYKVASTSTIHGITARSLSTTCEVDFQYLYEIAILLLNH